DRDRGVDLRASDVRLKVVGGEPGASMPSVRARLEESWGAKCFDHAGMTEVGAFTFPCSAQAGLHINEAEFFAEILDPVSGQPVPDGERGELVLTNFGRYGYPVIRYRTGDIVIRSDQPCSCGHPFRLLPGGVVGRKDDMVVVRGVNIFPQSIETIIREFPDISEFRIVFYTESEMDQVKVKVECSEETAEILRGRFRERLGLRVEVEVVPPKTLPRFEMKARRVEDHRIRRV
ncbi:MAG: phenylacetate--CoA ligase family protein, partial [Alicyclobacillaceae bacterium]|nr:phenylacetate--CoA ligase family protein [Alicyclobacillaceae bacterium]